MALHTHDSAPRADDRDSGAAHREPGTEPEQAISSAASRYAALVRLSPDAILVDRNGRVEFANAAATTLFGARETGDLIGKASLDLVHPDDRARIGEGRKRLLDSATGTAERLELTIVRLDGATRVVEAHAAAFEDASGKGLEVIFRDITDRKCVEEALRRSEERLRAHIDNSPLAVIEFDPQFRVIGWSQAAERLFGWTADEIVGREIAQVRWVHDEDVESVRRQSEVLLSGTDTRTLNVNRNYRKDGSVVHCEWYSSALHDREGRLISVMSQVLDVTDRDRAEAELRNADQRKTEFLAVLSHELRNCLAPIKNAMRLLERASPGGPRISRARAVVRRQMEHVTRLVDDLLDISRISTGKVMLERTRCDARDLVARECEDLRATFHARGIELRLDLTSEPLWLDADERRLVQILRNLLGNAIKFTTPPGAVDVTVAKGASGLELRVRDTGAGIDPHVLETIFEPFAQLEQASRTAHGGMGIGLALVKNFVQMHGGTVCAKSDGRGRGAEFVVTLPLSSPPAPAAALPRPAVLAAIPSLDILIVDDNRDTAETLGELLQLEGHRTRTAFDARSASKAFKEQEPDVLISDIGLPDLSGYELVRELRQLEVKRAFAIAMTGYAQADDVRRADEAGFDAHLPKPAPLDRLDELLARAASARHAP